MSHPGGSDEIWTVTTGTDLVSVEGIAYLRIVDPARRCEEQRRRADAARAALRARIRLATQPTHAP